MTKVMSKQDFTNHVRQGESVGVSASETYEQIRKNGYQIQGDLNPLPPQSGALPALDVNQLKTNVNQPNPPDGNFLGNTMRGANREIVNGLTGLGDRIAHPSKLVGDAKNILSAGANIATGLGESFVQGLTGKQVPQYNPDGTVTHPQNGTPEQQVAKSFLDSSSNALMHPIKTFENHPITTTMVIVPALRALAEQTGTIEKASTLAQKSKAFIDEKGTQLGLIDPNAGIAQSKAAMSNLEPSIQKGISKGISPSVLSKKNVGQVDQYYKDASLAVHTIVHNREGLQLVDDLGLPTNTNLPQNLQQFSHAVDQTKKLVFDQYDALQKQAGQVGATVNTKSVAHDLVNAMADPKFAAIEDQNPGIADYILQRATSLESRATYTPEQAQIAIKNYNDSLSSFYNNPSMETFQKANVDAMIANRLREGLDTSIMGATGEAYQPLKKQYGSLKAIEKDVLNAAMRNARKNTKGLIDFSDIFSGGDLVNGLISHNPALFAKGAAQMGIKQYLKFVNDPNNIVKNMFEKVNSVLHDAEKINDVIDLPVPPAQ